MNKAEIVKNSLVQNTNYWIFIWILMMLNLFALLSIGQGYSHLLLVISLLALLAGIMIIRLLALKFSRGQIISAEMSQHIADTMDKIKPVCNGVFDREMDRLIEPVLTELEEDFSKSLTWLWESSEDYRLNLQEGIAETKVVINLADTVDRNKTKIIRKLQEKLASLLVILDDVEQEKANHQEEIREHLISNALEIKQGMKKEKDIFYEYVEKLLVQQIMNSDKNVDFNDCLNIDKLGEQFSVVIEKSVQVRLGYYKDIIIKDLEYLVADIVGKMQKGALQLRNTFTDIEELIEALRLEFSEENAVFSRRLRDSLGKITKLREQASDFLVTLAWQDILIEKRWQDIQIKLFISRDQILEKVSSELVQYIIGILNDTIPGYGNMTSEAETALIYKACLDAEIIYQLAGSENTQDLLSDDVYALLQFVRPVELMIAAGLRISESGIAERRLIKEQLRKPEFQQLWDKVLQEITLQKPELLTYIEDAYPSGFAAFCSSPYIRQKPENANDAAWALFMAAFSTQSFNQEGFLLIGLLLATHRLRNKYIHPLKGLPISLEQTEEIEYLRFCAYKSIEILLSIPLYGMVRNTLI